MNLPVLELLLDSKADPMINDKNGFNAVDYAIETPIALDLIHKFFPKAKPNKKVLPAGERKGGKQAQKKNN
jgi:hypothetical protein